MSDPDPGPGPDAGPNEDGPEQENVGDDTPPPSPTKAHFQVSICEASAEAEIINYDTNRPTQQLLQQSSDPNFLDPRQTSRLSPLGTNSEMMNFGGENSTAVGPNISLSVRSMYDKLADYDFNGIRISYTSGGAPGLQSRQSKNANNNKLSMIKSPRISSQPISSSLSPRESKGRDSKDQGDGVETIDEDKQLDSNQDQTTNNSQQNEDED